MNLLRLLPGGTEAKLQVDKAIDACAPIGNLREDIYRCRPPPAASLQADSSQKQLAAGILGQGRAALGSKCSSRSWLQAEAGRVQVAVATCSEPWRLTACGQPTTGILGQRCASQGHTGILACTPEGRGWQTHCPATQCGPACRCKEATEVPAARAAPALVKPAAQSAAASARRLGLHYLTRYFFLITFQARCWLEWRGPRRAAKSLRNGSWARPAARAPLHHTCTMPVPACAVLQAFMASQEAQAQAQGRPLRSGTFARWVADRKELKHLMGSLTLEPAV